MKLYVCTTLQCNSAAVSLFAYMSDTTLSGR